MEASGTDERRIVKKDSEKRDLRYVGLSLAVAEAISRYLKAGTMVVFESTTYPGTAEELIKPILENGSGLICGRDFYLGFSPEQVYPGNLIYKAKNTPKVPDGCSDRKDSGKPLP